MAGVLPAPSAEKRRPVLSASVMVALGALSLLGPLGTDTFLPGMPAIAAQFGSTAAAAQLALTGFTLGMAVGQLIAGPVSDAVGRRGPMLVGSAVMVAVCAGAAAAPTLVLLVAATSVAGLSCSFGLTLARTVVVDLARGSQVIRANAVLGGILSLGPIIGPVAGVGLIAIGGWRATCLGLAGFSLLCTVAVFVMVPESHPSANRLRGGLRALASVIGTAFRNRRYLGTALVAWFSFAAMFAYIGGSPFIIQKVLGFSTLGYAIAFGVNGAGLIVTSLLSGRLIGRFDERGLLALGLGLQGLGAAIVAVDVVTGLRSPLLLLPGMFFIACAAGFVIGPSFAYSVRDLRFAAGTAIAILGAVQWLIAGLTPPLVSSAGSTSLVPFAVIVACAVALAWAAWILVIPHGEERQVKETP